ncbi:Histidine phosphatase [Fragilaria crotonensis]|nr:Histidine phosphatase [Fragilaria crotonensis]
MMKSLTLFLLSILPPADSFHIRITPQRTPTAIFEKNELTRRQILSIPNSIVGISLLGLSRPVNARGLVQFPCNEPLGNTYHFMCAGQSLLDQQDIWSTNPLFVTNREAALSDLGIEQVEDSIARVLIANNINPSIIRYAIAASSTDTTNLVARALNVGRDKLVPEFNYLEPRAIGAWDTTSRSSTEPAVWAMDAMEAGRDGLGGRPPPKDDGTPHERLADVAVRLRQLLSVLETQYSGDAVLLVACDGTTLALLSCMMAGIPFEHVHELEYKPGEVRLNVTMDSTLALWEERKAAGLVDYNKVIEKGKVELDRLRGMDDIVSLKDQRIDEEQRELEAVYQKEQKVKRRIETEERLARQERAQRVAAEPSTVPPTAAAGVGLGLMAAAVVVNSAEKSPEPLSSLERVTPPLDETLPEPIEEPPLRVEDTFLAPPREDRVFDPKLDVVQKSSKPLPWTASPSSFPDFEARADLGTPMAPTVATSSSRVTAEQAMEDYLNQDDGGEGWLQVMSELLDAGGDDDEQ